MKLPLAIFIAVVGFSTSSYANWNHVPANGYYSEYKYLYYCTPYNLREGNCSDHSIGGAQKAGYDRAYVSRYDYDRKQYRAQPTNKAARY